MSTYNPFAPDVLATLLAISRSEVNAEKTLLGLLSPGYVIRSKEVFNLPNLFRQTVLQSSLTPALARAIAVKIAGRLIQDLRLIYSQLFANYPLEQQKALVSHPLSYLEDGLILASMNRHATRRRWMADFVERIERRFCRRPWALPQARLLRDICQTLRLLDPAIDFNPLQLVRVAYQSSLARGRIAQLRQVSDEQHLRNLAWRDFFGILGRASELKTAGEAQYLPPIDTKPPYGEQYNTPPNYSPEIVEGLRQRFQALSQTEDSIHESQEDCMDGELNYLLEIMQSCPQPPALYGILAQDMYRTLLTPCLGELSWLDTNNLQRALYNHYRQHALARLDTPLFAPFVYANLDRQKPTLYRPFLEHLDELIFLLEGFTPTVLQQSVTIMQKIVTALDSLPTSAPQQDHRWQQKSWAALYQRTARRIKRRQLLLD